MRDAETAHAEYLSWPCGISSARAPVRGRDKAIAKNS